MNEKAEIENRNGRERESTSKVYLNGVDNVSSDVDLINAADGGGINSVVS